LVTKDYVKALGMHPHPEGGYYLENYRSGMTIHPDGFKGSRAACTSIYFLLEKGQFSALHKIKSDEIWHFYDGGPLEIIEISPEGKHSATILGRNILDEQKLSYVVKAGNWFASRPMTRSEFSLVGCTVSPGFDFKDFEMPERNWFLEKFPEHSSLICDLTHS
jgi:predicted cupin superfamily sugar epimerase